jgi:hypothetical protein
MKTNDQQAPRIWWSASGVLGALAIALVCRTVPGIPGYLPIASGVVMSAFVAVGAVVAGRPLAMSVCQIVCVVAGSGWATVAAYAGITPVAVMVLVIGAAGMTVPMTYLPATKPEVTADVTDLPPGRTEREESIQALLRRLTKQPVTVMGITPWDVEADGMDIHVALPESMTVKDLSDYCDRIASAPVMHLKQGCIVTVTNGEYQCEAIVRVMLRDCLQDAVELSEPTTPASIMDSFPLIRSPRGGWFEVCLRISCMIIGGTTGSGKTTLLNRIIAYLARCTDVLIWVVDFNGGGLGAPWNAPFERGDTDRPIVDWLGDTERESAVIMACAKAIAKARKTDRESVRLRREANSNTLPVSATKPAIVVITDEGGEVRKAAGVLGQIVCSQISSLAQIGREQGLRVIMSVLRGTADLLDKGLRAVCAIRVCLRLDEPGEADHILGRNPGRTELRTIGSAWLFRAGTDHRPTIGGSVDVVPDFIDRHAIACAVHRPELDEAARRICANVKLVDVFNGKDPDNYPDLCAHPVMDDVVAGMAYANRHQRRADRMAAIERGDDPDAPTSSVDRAQRTMTTLGGDVVPDSTASFLNKVDKLGKLAGGKGAGRPASGKRPSGTTATGTDQGAVDAAFQAMTTGDRFLASAPDPVIPQVGQTSGTTIGVNPEVPSDIVVPPTSGITLRERVEGRLRDLYPNGMRAGEIEIWLSEEQIRFSRGNLFHVLGDMVRRGDIDHPDGDANYYYKPVV